MSVSRSGGHIAKDWRRGGGGEAIVSAKINVYFHRFRTKIFVLANIGRLSYRELSKCPPLVSRIMSH